MRHFKPRIAGSGAAALLLAVVPPAQALPSPIHVVAGFGSGPGGVRMAIEAVAREDPSAVSGRVVWQPGDGRAVVISLDCGVVRSSRFGGGYGISHRLFAAGPGDDGVRYYVIVSVDGDTTMSGAGRLSAEADPAAPCGARATPPVVAGEFHFLP